MDHLTSRRPCSDWRSTVRFRWSWYVTCQVNITVTFWISWSQGQFRARVQEFPQRSDHFLLPNAVILGKGWRSLWGKVKRKISIVNLCVPQGDLASPFQLSGSYSFPHQCFHFNGRHPVSGEFNLCYNSASCRVRFCVWFSAISAMWLQKIRVSRADIEAFKSFIWLLHWEFKSLGSSSGPCPQLHPWLTLSSNIRSNQPISLRLLICSKVNIRSPRSFLLISGWLGVLRGGIFCISLSPCHGLSVLSLFLE